MKRMALITLALCAVLLAATGAGVVTARQAGTSSVFLFDVATTDIHGSGKLMIDVKQHTFVFNGKGFAPGKTYLLQYYHYGLAGTRIFAEAKASSSGNLHAAGTWEDAALPTTQGFGVSVELPIAGMVFGDVYYIPASGPRPTYYLFKAGTSPALWVTFYYSTPSPGDFVNGKASAMWSGDTLTFTTGAKQFTVTMGYARELDSTVHTTGEGTAATYSLNPGVVTQGPVPLLGVPAGTFVLGDTPVKLVVNGNSYDEGGGHTDWNLVIFDPIQYSGAYSEEQ